MNESGLSMTNMTNSTNIDQSYLTLNDNVTFNSTSSLDSMSNSTIPFYDYDIATEPPLEELIPVSIVYGGTLILGMVGNGLVIFSVSRYEQMKTITNTFLLSLASADLLLVLICVPVKCVAFFSYVWRFGEFLCKSVHYIQNVSAICSVATLTVMSMERYYAIVHPMRAKYVCSVGRARRALIVLWILSFVLAIPILEGQEHITVGLRRQATWCLKEWDRPLYSKLYEVYMLCIILIIPVTVMSFAYFRICEELWFMSRNRSILRTPLRSTPAVQQNRLSSSERSPVLKVKFVDDDNTKKQVIKMLAAIVVVFIICWAPILINNVLVAFGFLPKLHVGPLKYLREAFHVMSYANSCVNPIVYGFMSRNFRQTFKTALCGCLKGKQYVRKLTFKSQSMVVQDRWNSTSGAHTELVSTTDMIEMTETPDKSSTDDNVKV